MFPPGKISCVIPVRDRASLVTGAVASALGQRTSRSLEIIVVDDGSTDGSGPRVRSRFPEVRVVTTPGLGPGLARNAGVEAAKGDVIMFLDSDDQWCPNHLEALMALIDQGMDMAYGVTYTWDQVGGGGFLIPDQARGPWGECLEAMARWCFLVPSSVAVTKRAFYSVGGFDSLDFGEDWHFFVKVAARYPLGFVPQVVTLRLLHRGSLSCAACSRDRIKGLLMELRQCLDGREKRILNHLDQALDLVDKEAHRWKTAQDWYNGMKGAGLV